MQRVPANMVCVALGTGSIAGFPLPVWKSCTQISQRGYRNQCVSSVGCRMFLATAITNRAVKRHNCRQERSDRAAHSPLESALA